MRVPLDVDYARKWYLPLEDDYVALFNQKIGRGPSIYEYIRDHMGYRCAACCSRVCAR